MIMKTDIAVWTAFEQRSSVMSSSENHGVACDVDLPRPSDELREK